MDKESHFFEKYKDPKDPKNVFDPKNIYFVIF
jgi:hypothetical protein